MKYKYTAQLQFNWKYILSHIIVFLSSVVVVCLLYKLHLIRSAGPLSKFLVTIVILFLFEYITLTRRSYQIAKGALDSGFFYCSFRHDQKSRQESDQFLKNIAQQNRRISIVCASGYDTFTRPVTPLHEAIRSCTQARIIMLNPDSDQVKKRANKIGMSPDEYRNQMIESLKFLKNIKQKKGNDINVKFYNNAPFWKFIILENSEYVWIQQYPNDRHVQDSPAFAFAYNKTRNQENIYTFFERHFEKRWQRHSLQFCDLTKF